MHKMSTTLHKCANEKGPKSIITNPSMPTNKVHENKDNLAMPATMDIEKENTLSKIILLYSKGLSQMKLLGKWHLTNHCKQRSTIYQR